MEKAAIKAYARIKNYNVELLKQAAERSLHKGSKAPELCREIELGNDREELKIDFFWQKK